MAINNLQLSLRILAVIQQHRPSNPILARDLAEMFCLGRNGERRVKAITRQLRLAGHKVGSSKTDPCGFFIGRTPDELRATAFRLFDEARSSAEQGRALLNFEGQAPELFQQVPELDIPPPEPPATDEAEAA